MKTQTYAIAMLLAASLAASCTKENERLTPGSASLPGQSELRRLSGTIVGFDSSFAPGNGRQFSFTGSNYQRLAGGVVTKSGSYQLIQDRAYLTGKLEDVVVFD